ncbi:GCN5-related N-acetyltransferase [Methylobacillus flagellatus KT]|uniref:GCN5-related N-acetyltransferase n=2 Tax=Methylobacillus flagellatus TaxID=405 RepID=Q1H3Z3_METFK|nr:GCN5-related N-acetyltransferase [Methylobacillus flagellatus KT]
MQASDLPAVMHIATQVHPGYPEEFAVFFERHRLYPQGCWIWEQAGAICGYLLSHPWYLDAPPELNCMLQTLPSQATTYYLHDIALMPVARGFKATDSILARLCAQATHEQLDTLSLIAVNQSAAFWQRHHFQTTNHLVPAAKLQSYDHSACYMVRQLA